MYGGNEQREIILSDERRIFRRQADGPIGKETDMDSENKERNDELLQEEETVGSLNSVFEEEQPGETAAGVKESLEPEMTGTASLPDPEPVTQCKESRKERKAREKEEARLEKEMARQRAKDEKTAARAAKKAERKYRNIPTVIIMSLILAVLVAGLGFLGWKYIGLLQERDGITAEKEKLSAEIENLGKSLADKEAQIREQISQIEDKNALISNGDAAAKELSEKIAELETQIKSLGEEAEEVLDIISGRDPLGVAYSGNFYADRAVAVIEDGGSFPLNVSVMYGEKETAISYSFDDSSKNVGTLTLSQDTITGSSGLISVKAKKKTADDPGLAVLRFENEHSSDFFYVIIVIK